MSPWLPMENEDDGWDLHAVVRSCRSAARPKDSTSGAALLPRSPNQDPLLLNPTDAPLPSCSADLIDIGNTLLELEELCRPFISETQHPKSLLSPRSPSPTVAPENTEPVAPPPALRPQTRPASQMTRSKRRKNQQKRVVCHLPTDGLSGDMWAWRKYGQKPIKGSPYPRGYYRCSSSKGCLARKQVERSRTDPGIFVITYTAEHNHPLPTHRNSLAGSTRQKFPAASDGGDQPETSTSAVTGLSPNTPLTSSMEDELLRRRWRPEKREEGSTEEDEEAEEEDEDAEMLLVEDMEVVGHDDDFLFRGVEDLQGSSSSASAVAFYGNEGVGEAGDGFFSRPWSSNNNNAAALPAGKECLKSLF